MSKRVAIVHPNFDIPFIFESANKHDIELIVIMPSGEKISAQYAAVKSINILPLYESPQNALSTLKELHACWQFDGIMAVKEACVVWTAEAAQLLDLRGISPEAAMSARDKNLMRTLFKQHGLIVPKNIVLNSPKDLEDTLNLTFPCIVKPASGFNSAGVQLVYNDNELVQAVNHVQQLNEHVYHKYSWHKAGNFSKIIIEEFIPGTEYVVELYALDGDIRALNCGFKGCPAGPYFEEVEYLSPPDLPTNIIEKIQNVAIEGMRALKLDNGHGHCELRINKDGNPVILEIGARVGGSGCAYFNLEAATGVDFAFLYFSWLIGKVTDDMWPPKHTLNKSSSSWILPLGGSGVLKSIEGLENVANHPDFRHIINFARFGARYRPYPDFDGFLVIVFAQHDSPQKGLEFFRFLENSIRVIWE